MDRFSSNGNTLVVVIIGSVIVLGIIVYTFLHEAREPLSIQAPRPTSIPSISQINYDDLFQAVIEIPQEIPLHQNTRINEKLVGFDKSGYKIYRVDIMHDDLSIQEIYEFYKTELLNEGWNISIDEKTFCSESNYFCPQWINVIAIKDNINLTIYYRGDIGYIQWHVNDRYKIALTINEPLDPEVFPGDFHPELILVQTETRDKKVYLEMYSPITTPHIAHENLLRQKGYPRCASGSASQIFAYSCSTDDESEEYYINIVSAEIYNFDIVTIRYTQK